MPEQLFLGGLEPVRGEGNRLELDDLLVHGGQAAVEVGLVAAQADGHDAGVGVGRIGDFDAVDPSVALPQDAAEDGVRGGTAQDIAQQVGRQPFLFLIKRGRETADDGIHLVVFLVHGLIEPYPGGEPDACRSGSGQRLAVRSVREPPPDEPEHFFLEFLFRNIRHEGEGHGLGTELLGHETAQFRRLDLADGCDGAEDRPFKGMAGIEFLFEPVIDIVGRTVLVG